MTSQYKTRTYMERLDAFEAMFSDIRRQAEYEKEQLGTCIDTESVTPSHSFGHILFILIYMDTYSGTRI